MKTTFLVVGTQKGGTTTLNSCLSQHPDICMGSKKEIHFFDNDEYHRTQEVDYADYEIHFDRHPENKITGESTPIYMYWKPAMERIHAYNPNIKIIAMLRNPVDRAYSHWQMEINRNFEHLSFLGALKAEKTRLVNEGVQHQHRIYSYLDRGFYSRQINRMLQYFNRTQLYFIKSENFLQRPKDELNQVFNFLNIDECEVDCTPQHIGIYKRSMEPVLRRFISKRFMTEIEKIEHLLGWDCTDWKEGAYDIPVRCHKNTFIPSAYETPVVTV